MVVLALAGSVRGQTLTTLYRFGGGNDGRYPHAGVIQATDGGFYGTTELGGTDSDGVVFQIDPTGSFTNLYSFVGAGSPVSWSKVLTAIFTARLSADPATRASYSGSA